MKGRGKRAAARARVLELLAEQGPTSGTVLKDAIASDSDRRTAWGHYAGIRRHDVWNAVRSLVREGLVTVHEPSRGNIAATYGITSEGRSRVVKREATPA